MTRNEEVVYDVMAEENDLFCKEIGINVEVSRDEILNENEVEIYDLRNDDDLDDLELRMENLKVGDSFKIAVTNNPSVGYFYELETQ